MIKKIMKPIPLLALMLLLTQLVLAQRQITQAEYFIDTDPGAGNAISVSATDGNLNDAIEALFSNGISTGTVGLHSFNIRVKDEQNNWGPVFKTIFYTSSPLTVRNIKVNQAELFWNADPGQGNGVSLIAFDGNFNDAIETISGSISTLPGLGLHTLNIRVKDQQNNWGPIFKTIVNITAPLTIRNIHITQAELFFDNDPGIGNGISLLAFDGNFNDAIEAVSGTISSLPSNGIHLLNIRVKDNQNNWGSTFKTVINITDPLVLRTIKIQAGEFFFDTDPGLGQGVGMLSFDGNFNDAIETINQTWAFLPDTGMHVLNVRAKDGNGTWGPAFKTILRVLPCVNQPTVTITPTTVQQICPGDVITFDAVAGFNSYTWFKGSEIVGAGQTFTAGVSGFYRVYAVDANGCGAFSPFTEVKNNFYDANITASSTTTFCQGGSVTLTAASGGSSYSWNTGSSAQSIVVASSGTFVVTVSNGFCLGTDTVEVVVNNNPSNPIIITDGPSAFCPGDSVKLTCSALANAYAWSTNQYTPSITVRNSGIYSVTITDANNCQATSTINVSVFANPITSVSNNATFCEGDHAQLTIAGGVSYLWKPATGLNSATIANPLANPASSTQYTVYSTGLGGCVDSAFVDVFVNPTPTVNATSNVTQLCEGDILNLFASPNGASSYNWSGPSGFSSINQNPVIGGVSLNNSGIYQVDVYNSVGCSDTKTISITVNPTPTAFASVNSNSLCAGQTLSLSALPNGMNSYSWIGPNGFADPTQNPSISNLTGSNQGTYILTVNNGSCSSTASVALSVFNAPSVSASSNFTILCEGSLLNLFADPAGASSYVWSGPNIFNSNIQNPVITNVTPLNTGTYVVTAYNEHGCNTSAQISINVVAEINAAISGNSPVCEKSSIELNGLPNGMLTYQWNGPNGYTSNTQNAIVTNADFSNAGTYTLTVSSGLCNASMTYTVNIKQGPNIAVTQFGSVLNAVQNDASYQWVKCSNNFTAILGETEQTFTALENDQYAVIVISNGCADTSNCFNINSLSIEELNANSNWSVYPNPNNGNFTINANTEMDLELMDYTGKVISVYHITHEELYINENIAAGMYFMRDKKSGLMKKIIVQ